MDSKVRHFTIMYAPTKLLSSLPIFIIKVSYVAILGPDSIYPMASVRISRNDWYTTRSTVIEMKNEAIKATFEIMKSFGKVKENEDPPVCYSALSPDC